MMIKILSVPYVILVITYKTMGKFVANMIITGMALNLKD